MEPIVSFQNYTFQYRAQAEPTLKDINFELYPGEKVLIVGASGSGKSTLANCINGLIPFSYAGESEGKLLVDGRETKTLSLFELSKLVGTVLQDPDGQFIGLTVGEDIAFALENDCVPQEKMRSITQQAADLVNIGDHLQFAPHELSGGQKQRVSLAGVMVDDVKILLFDEPLANLDPAAGKQTIALIEEIRRKTGAAVLLIEHRLEDALYRDVDRIVLMDEGRIVANEKPEELLAGDLLQKHGIREPLYLAALRCAGVSVTPEMRPQHLESMTLSAKQMEQVNRWYRALSPAQEPPEREALLEVRELTFGYDPHTPNLTEVSFAVRAGEMLSIVGRNGAGKSTLSKLICGFERPQKGDVLLRGRSLRSDSIRERAGHIGYVMQNPNQMISKPMIYDEVALALRKSGFTEAEVRARVEDALRICGLFPFRRWPVSALSFGQKKRVTIASVLVQRPEIILLDEPTAGQDFRHYTEIMEFLCSLNAQGITVMMITHDMHLMLEYTPRALVFSEGRLIADEKSARVLCDRELVERAALKETSLFGLAQRCGITPPEAFCECFIHADREVRIHGA